MRYVFTSESVSEGHPDKLCDLISDTVLDYCLQQDPLSKVACECLISARHLVIAGEISSLATHPNVHDIARDVLHRVGYNHPSTGFDLQNAIITDALNHQSREINAAVTAGGAGDQGLMFGYACNETPERMPLPIALAHRLILRQQALRHNGTLPWLMPDAKSQVSVIYEDGLPIGVDKVVLSTQHHPDITLEEVRQIVIDKIILPVIREVFVDGTPSCLVNPAGTFTLGGPHADTGLTGRKIIVDTYGGSCPHGGGAFSGKDPSKVDRSGAYMARFIANHLVASGLADRCTVQISFAIGIVDPTSIYVNSHGTGRLSDQQLTDAVQKIFELTPGQIIQTLDLCRPIYRPTASGGHFGRPEFSWEQINPGILTDLQSNF